MPCQFASRPWKGCLALGPGRRRAGAKHRVQPPSGSAQAKACRWALLVRAASSCRRRAAAARRRQQQRCPAQQPAVAQHRGRLVQRGNVALLPQPGRGDQAHQVEGHVKAALAQALQHGQAQRHFLRGGVAQGRNFQHQLLRMEQLQVAASQALVRAIGEQQLLAHQRFAAGVRQRGEHQRHVGHCGVRRAGARAVEQFAAHHLVARIDGGLACNQRHAARASGHPPAGPPAAAGGKGFCMAGARGLQGRWVSRRCKGRRRSALQLRLHLRLHGFLHLHLHLHLSLLQRSGGAVRGARQPAGRVRRQSAATAVRCP